jgi:hypothetical protein
VVINAPLWLKRIRKSNIVYYIMPFNFMIKKRKNIFIEIIENKNDYEIVIRDDGPGIRIW